MTHWKRLGWAGSAMLLMACEAGERDNLARYVFLPTADVADTNPLPLKHLLLVQQHADEQVTLFYYFTGELSAMDLGLQSLERIRDGFGRYRFRFELPLRTYAQPLAAELSGVAGAAGFAGNAASAGAGGRSGMGGAAGAPSIEDLALARLELDVDDDTIEMVPLSDAGLYAVGASRYLSQTSTGQFSVNAYVGAYFGPLTLDELRLESPQGALRYRASLSQPSFTAAVADGVRLSFQTDADYVELDLFQELTRNLDGLPIDTRVSTSSAASDTHLFPRSIVDDSSFYNCWQSERPLMARLTQVVRSYVVRSNGDFAVEHRRFDQESLPGEAWAGDSDNFALADYCTGYE